MLSKTISRATLRSSLPFASAIRRFSSTDCIRHTSLSDTITRLDYAAGADQPSEKTQRGYRGPAQATILDWSGTTADAHVLAPAVVFVEVFKKYGVEISMVEARGPMGNRKDLHIAKILEMPAVRERWTKIKGAEPTQADVDAMFADFVPMQNAVLPKYTTLLPGVAETVAHLREKHGMKFGSTTGFTKSMVDILLRDAEKQGYKPDSSVAGDQVINGLGFRPAPFMIYQNLLNLGVYPIESVIKVDDTVTGVGEGVNAGCWSIGVYGWSNYTDVDSLEQWDAMSDEEKARRQEMSKQKLLAESGAHYVCYDLRDLPKIVEDINARLANGEKPQQTIGEAQLK